MCPLLKERAGSSCVLGAGHGVIDDPIRDWREQTDTSLPGSNPQVHSVPGEARQWQMNLVSIYLSICCLHRGAHADLPPINLYPVNTTPIYQHISLPNPALLWHNAAEISTYWLWNYSRTHISQAIIKPSHTSDLSHGHLHTHIMQNTDWKRCIQRINLGLRTLHL